MRGRFLPALLVLSGCTHITLRDQGDVIVPATAKHPERTYTYTYETSVPTYGWALACAVTGIFYGGACWGYLGMPTGAQLDEFERDEEFAIRRKLGHRFEIDADDPWQDGWGETQPRLTLKRDKGEDAKPARKPEPEPDDEMDPETDSEMDAEPEAAREPEPAPTRFVRAYYDRDDLRLFFNDPDAGAGVNYQTVADWIVGAAVGLDGFALAASTTIKGTNGATETKSRSAMTVLHAAYDTEHFSWEAFDYICKGFEVRQGTASTVDSVPFDPDIKAQAYGLNTTWISSPERFVLPGRYTETGLPRRPGFSLLAGLQVSALELDSPHPLASGLSGADVTLVTASLGFGRTFVPVRHVDLSGSVQLGYGTRYEHVRDEPGWHTDNGTMIPARLGARYVDRDYSVGIYGIYDIIFVGAEDETSLGWQRNLIETYVGVNF